MAFLVSKQSFKWERTNLIKWHPLLCRESCNLLDWGVLDFCRLFKCKKFTCKLLISLWKSPEIKFNLRYTKLTGRAASFEANEWRLSSRSNNNFSTYIFIILVKSFIRRLFIIQVAKAELTSGKFRLQNISFSY